MTNTVQDHRINVASSSVSEDQKTLALLYDEHAAVVLGFLEKKANDRAKAEELLQAVFLALPARLNEFDPHKGRFVLWLLNLARTIAGTSPQNGDFKINGENPTTNGPIHGEINNVHSLNAETASEITSSRPLTVGKEKSPARIMIQSDGVVELLYVKGYTFTQAATELNIEEHTVRLLLRTELKKYRRS